MTLSSSHCRTVLRASSPRSSIRMPWLWIWAPTIASKNRPLDEFYGGDFYEHWTYGMPELITGKAADGSYTRQRAALPGTKRIAGPGCNVTATTLALQPGIAEGLVESQDIVADLVVGYSGAGKNLKRTNLLAAEALQSALPYSVGGKHRHIPEILQNFAHTAGKSAAEASEFTLGFTPILAPMSRGILATVSARMTDKAKTLSDEEIRAVWSKAMKVRTSWCCCPRARCPPPATSSDPTQPTCRSSPTARPAASTLLPPSTTSTVVPPDKRSNH